ncbi:MAG TPA: DUF1800 domain-containing protein [Pyrinomonadaceae bacterium]|nr:DUF1800 domain-containing protein [Pyrinomonadaceae bacterium]
MRNRAFPVRQHFAGLICVVVAIISLGARQQAAAVVQKSPLLFSQSATSTRAIALESVTLRAEPFKLTSEGYFSPNDPRTRIALFCMNLDLLAGEGANALTADVQDATGTIYPLRVEYVGEVPPTVNYITGAIINDFRGISMIIVRLNDLMPADPGDVLIRVNLHGMSSNRVRFGIGHVGGGLPDDPGAIGTPAPQTVPSPTPTPTPDPFTGPASDADTVRFLEQATWGATTAEVNRVKAMGFRAYLNEQFNLPVANVPKGSNYPDLSFPVDDPAQGCPSGSPPECIRDNYSIYPVQKTFFTNALSRQDQLRQRVAFALHQITVVSGLNPLDRPSWLTVYLQALDRGAFGNYRTLLQDITLNPEMGEYLDMRLSTRTNPNENFAREVLQLFSLGVNELNTDGTAKLDAQGIPIPAYTQTNVNEFTRLFTGWNLSPTLIAPNTTNWRDPMVPRGGTQHDFGAKTLLNGVTTAACSSASGAANVACAQADLTVGLDNLFNHPNVGPFIGKQLIQHMVTSNPSPGYVERVARAFNNNCQGLYPDNPCSGARGDMKAVVTAILLDPEARGDVKTDPNYGKLREPVQYITGILRGFNATSDGVLGNRSTNGDLPGSLDQPVFQPATVFSYYQPGYEVPGTGILGPAFGILSTSTTLRRANVANQLIYSGILVNANTPTGTQLNLSSLESLAANPGAIADQLNTLMLHGTMSTQFRTSIVNAMNAIPTSDGSFARKRAQVAAYLVVTSSQFDIQR